MQRNTYTITMCDKPDNGEKNQQQKNRLEDLL